MIDTNSWAIDPERTLVLIQTQGGMVNAKLMLYLAQRFPVGNVSPVSYDDQLVVARNRIIGDHLRMGGSEKFSHFVLFDDDMMPDQRTDPMFQVSADLAGAKYDTPGDNSWSQPNDVHCGAMVLSRRLLRTIKPPYFKYTYNEAMTACLSCECNWIRDRAVEAGLPVVRAGSAVNQNRRSWCGR